MILFVISLYFVFDGNLAKWISDYRLDKEWNQEDEHPAKNMKRTVVPKLDQLFSKPNLIEELKKNPYFIGYDHTGQYGAFLIYDSDEKAYQLQIYDSFKNRPEYSLQIPLQDPTKSNEIILAQEALETGFNIKIPPKSLDWENKTKLKIDKETWNLIIEEKNAQLKLILSKSKSKDTWSFSLEGWTDSDIASVKLFNHPNDYHLLTIVQQKPIFLHLSLLTSRNSDHGKKDEVDQWLYGDFEIVYDQNQTNDFKGYLAVAKKKNVPIKLYQQPIDQWVYADPSGKMKWYGNAEGIFDFAGKPFFQKEDPFYYSISPIYRGTPKELTYFMVDVFDKKTEKLLKTFLFQWDPQKRMMKISS
ncbi:hypothetical protein [Tepidibacillus sp. LV47]|uniref:hypothetical protein n=1 Tax=Tepidibacillus sp. LV47 TaxID=3398228 RepID=UPI003AABFD80